MASLLQVILYYFKIKFWIRLREDIFYEVEYREILSLCHTEPLAEQVCISSDRFSISRNSYSYANTAIMHGAYPLPSFS